MEMPFINNHKEVMQMLRNLTIVLLLLLFTGCASLTPAPQDSVSGDATHLNGVMAKKSISAECYALNNTFRVWGAVSKGLTVLAGLTPVTGGAAAVAAVVAASSAGVAVYADGAATDFVAQCTN
jgi:hypothetical protein